MVAFWRKACAWKKSDAQEYFLEPNTISVVYLETSLEVRDGHELYLDAIRGLPGVELTIVDAGKSSSSNRSLFSGGKPKYSVIVLSTPYPEHYSEEALRLIEGGHTLYLGYAPLWSNDKRLHFELEIYKKITVLVCHSEYQARGYLDAGCLDSQILRVGDPRMKLLADAENTSVIKERDYALLWTPHWTQDWYGYLAGYSTWVWASRVVKDYANAHPLEKVLVRPHPMVFGMIADRVSRGLIEESPFAQARKDWDELLSLANVSVSKGTTMLEDLANSSIVVSDYSSVAMYAESAHTRLAVTRNVLGPPISSLGRDVLANAPLLETPKQLESWISTLGTSQDSGHAPSISNSSVYWEADVLPPEFSQSVEALIRSLSRGPSS